MNPKRLIIAIAVVFAGIWLTDFLIHAVWLKQDYAATMSLWRPEAEMQQRIGWLMLGELFAAMAFTMLWAKGFAALNCLRCACMYGAMMGLFSQSASLITYAVQPIPPELVIKWFCAGIVQGVLMGVLVFFAYKPKNPISACPV